MQPSNMANASRIAAWALLTMAMTPAPASAARHTIIMEGMAFAPGTLQVKRGDTVAWVNKGLFSHTATAQDRSFDSREIVPGKPWKYTADKNGSFAYMCALRPSMKGILVVQ